ncbi:ABC transporter permease [Nocardia tengchongensis]
MTRFLSARLAQALVCVWGIATIVFVLTKIIPGDPARIAAGQNATPQQVAQARIALGLDRPWPQQYLSFLTRALHGDLGRSAVTHQPVAQDLGRLLPNTMQLVFIALLVIVAAGVPIGVVAAVNAGRPLDTALRLLLTVLGGAPVFWLAILLQFGLAEKAGVLPISGGSDIGVAPRHITGFTLLDALLSGNGAAFASVLRHLILPAFALAAPFLAHLARNVRTNMIGALDTEFVTFAYAKGIDRRRVVRHHALRAGLPSSVTLLGMQLGWMIGSALLVETVFATPGMGTYLNQAVLRQDTFAILGGVLVVGVVVTGASLLVDLAQIRLDPRVRAALLPEAVR